MTKKGLWIIISGLVAINVIMVIFLIASNYNSLGSGREKVAIVGSDKVTKKELLAELEKQYGETVLKQLVDDKIIIQLAKKYNIEISDEYLSQEYTMLKAMYNSNNDTNGDEKEWKEQLKLNMYLEELLTLDVVISDEEMKQYYEMNKQQYTIKPSYNVSQIVVNTNDEAAQIIKELESGANFSVLAMESSLDEFSANDGGELGYISEDDDRFTEAFFDEVKQLKKGEVSKPIETGENFTIIKLNDYIVSDNFTYEDLKKHLRRKIALDQMDISISTKPFWDELDVNVLYSQPK